MSVAMIIKNLSLRRLFRQSSEATTGMCRYIHAGGTWDLPGLVTVVKPAS
ncbi:hypothetical protein [Kalamiella sp. sgz302252]